MIEYIPIISLLIAMAIILPVAIWLEKRGRDRKRSLIVPDERSFLPHGWSIKIAKIGSVAIILIILACVSICLTGCGDDHKPNAEQSSVSGAESVKLSLPNLPDLPKPPGATTTSKDKPTTATSTTTPTTTPTTTSPASTGTTEQCRYAGRYNGDRATWYCSKNKSQYPAKLTIIISGCVTRQIDNSGKRYESGGLIVKQSEVTGRGMAIIIESGCKSMSASVRY